MADAPLVNIPEWSVSELSAALKRTVEDAYGYVRVRGEVSGYRGPHSSGHCYFALKDDTAKIDAVVWKGVFGRMRFKPEEGLEVIASGRLTTYPGKSSYQIIIESLEPAGVGALMALLEERKRKLAAEGLFSDARKQLLPYLPEVVGVVTSPTGAVIRDILHRLADRFPRRVLVWPVRVQGDGAAEQIAAAIRGMNALPENGPIPRPDLLIVARGGGSLEDLWCFNEEIVVRAAADSMIPLISAVGHETDITLIDFAADKRAPTPTAAAEMAVPVRADLIAQVDTLERRRVAVWLRCMEARRTELRSAARALPSADALLAVPRQRLDNLGDRLPRALRANAHAHEKQLARAAGRLTPSLLSGRLQRCGERVAALDSQRKRAAKVLVAREKSRLDALAHRLTRAMVANREAQRARIVHERARLQGCTERARFAMTQILERRQIRVERAGQLLAAFSYHGVLARGFALVRDEAGRPVRAVAQVAPGQALEIEFADGRVAATAGGGADGMSPPRKESRRPRAARAEQGSLFEP